MYLHFRVSRLVTYFHTGDHRLKTDWYKLVLITVTEIDGVTYKWRDGLITSNSDEWNAQGCIKAEASGDCPSGPSSRRIGLV